MLATLPPTCTISGMVTSNLKRRHQTWYARLTVPPALRARLDGRTEYVRSLKTRDLREANQLKHRVLAELRNRDRNLAIGEMISHLGCCSFRDARQCKTQGNTCRRASRLRLRINAQFL